MSLIESSTKKRTREAEVADEEQDVESRRLPENLAGAHGDAASVRDAGTGDHATQVGKKDAGGNDHLDAVSCLLEL